MAARVSTSVERPAADGGAGNRSIERGFLLLSILAQRPMRLGELAASADLAKSTTSRLVATLAELGAVEVVDATIRVGPLITALAFGAGDDRDVLRSVAAPVLRALAEDVGETAALGVSEGDDVLYLAQYEGSASAVEAGDWTGHRHPSHGTAFGLVLMAEWEGERRGAYLAEPLVAFTASTVTDPAEIEASLAAARERGVMWAVDQFADEVTGCAAPVRGADRATVAAIGCFAPTYRFPGDASPSDVETRVRAAAEELSGVLGRLPGRRIGPV